MLYLLIIDYMLHRVRCYDMRNGSWKIMVIGIFVCDLEECNILCIRRANCKSSRAFAFLTISTSSFLNRSQGQESEYDQG